MGDITGTCIKEEDDIEDMNDYGLKICNEGSTITATGPSDTKIRIYYGLYYGHSTYTFFYKDKTYSLPATIPCTNNEFDCDPYDGWTKHCRYKWIYPSAKAVVGPVDHGGDPFVTSEAVGNVLNAHPVEGEDMFDGNGLYVDGVPFVPSSTDPPRILEPLSEGVSVGPLEMTDIAAILVIMVSLINLCYCMRKCARKCLRKSGALSEYRKVDVMASETEDTEKEEEEEQQML